VVNDNAESGSVDDLSTRPRIAATTASLTCASAPWVAGTTQPRVVGVSPAGNRTKGTKAVGLGEALVAIPTSSFGGALEFSLVTEAAVRAWSAAPSFEVHVNTHEEPFVVDGSDRAGDQDLVIHFAIVRARGRALIGLEPGELFPEPDRALLIRAFLSDLRTAKDEGAAWWEGHDRPELASRRIWC
jgi:hypothetical protein